MSASPDRDDDDREETGERVFLTGGTGLVGSHLARRLRARSVPVVALQRESSDTRYLEGLGCRVVRGDVRDPPERHAERMAGCTALVHGAALVYGGASWPRVRAVNVDGTANVFRGAVQAKVSVAVHVSSVAVYGDVEGTVDEDAALDGPLPPRDLYARSKREAEAVAFQIHREEDLQVTVFRPSAVYGERDRLFAPRLRRFVDLPVVPLLGRGRETVPVVYAGNVAAALELALDGSGSGLAFNLGLDHPLSQRELLAGLSRALGKTPRLLPIPATLVRAVAGLSRLFGLSVPGARDLPLNRVIRLALEGNPYRSERAREKLGWAPPYSHAEGLERTGHWLRSREGVEG